MPAAPPPAAVVDASTTAVVNPMTQLALTTPFAAGGAMPPMPLATQADLSQFAAAFFTNPGILATAERMADSLLASGDTADASAMMANLFSFDPTATATAPPTMGASRQHDHGAASSAGPGAPPHHDAHGTNSTPGSAVDGSGFAADGASSSTCGAASSASSEGGGASTRGGGGSKGKQRAE